MNGIYEIYKLTPAGIRSMLVDRYESLDGELNWSTNSRFTVRGTCIGSAPLALADRVAIDRNGTQLFTGIVTEFTTDCGDVENGIRTWEAVLDDDAVVLDWRQVFATGNNTTPASIEVGEDVFDKLPNDNDETSTQSAFNRMLYYIRKHAGANAHSTRQVVTVNEPDDNTRGDQGRSAYHIKRLSDVVSEIGDSSGLYCKVNTNGSGARILTVPPSRDRTGVLVVSPEFGNCANWQKAESYPDFNAVWLLSAVTETDNGDDTTTQTRVWVYAEDDASIDKYGRIEATITKSDIKIVATDPEKPDVVPVTEAEVRKMLDEEAGRQLQDAAASVKWTVTMIENNNCAFMDDWKVGDKVTCVIEGESFTSTIETAQITYAGGTETVIPTIGEVEKGVYGKLFKMLNGIDKRLKAEEEN